MGETTLVESKVADAIALIKSLDASGDRPTFVVWYYYDDAEKWRLLVAGPTFDKLLPKDEHVAYRRLAEAVSNLSLPALAVSDLKLIKADAPLAKTIGKMFNTGRDGIVNAHFVDTTVNGLFIKEMFILRSAN